MATTAWINPMAGFGETRLPPVPVTDAIKRVRAFVTSPRSGYGPYDLAGAAARRAGQFQTVAPWSLLWADALAGRLSVGDLALFTTARREAFAALVAEVDEHRPLAEMGEDEREEVARLCRFGFNGKRAGVWAPKITKVAALYRPHAVPVLDGYLALAFGFGREAFSVGVAKRRDRIGGVVRALADWIKANGPLLADIRAASADVAPTISDVSDVRLLDMILWTAQDDRDDRPPSSPANMWLHLEAGPALDPADWEPVGLSGK